MINGVSDSFKFCPRCGSTFKPVDNMLLCGSCGLQYYLNPKPCAAVIVRNENNQILLSRRAINPRKGFWDVVGGYLEESETLEEGAKREVKEELRIDVDNLEYVGSYTHPYNYQDINYYTLTAAFTTAIKSDVQLNPHDDIDHIEWFKYADLPFADFAFPDQKNVFTKLAAKYNL